PDSFHKSVPNEIATLSVVTPADNDVLVIEDASDGYTKKKVLAGSLGGGGGGGSGLLIEEEASTNVNFLELEIPSGATDVRLTGLLRTTVSGTFNQVYATVGNGTVDTGSNYKWGHHWVTNVSSGASAAATDSRIDLGGGVLPGADSPAGVFAVLDMLISGYD